MFNERVFEVLVRGVDVELDELEKWARYYEDEKNPKWFGLIAEGWLKVKQAIDVGELGVLDISNQQARFEHIADKLKAMDVPLPESEEELKEIRKKFPSPLSHLFQTRND